MNIAYGFIFLALTALIAYATFLWWTETEAREKEKEEEIIKMKESIDALKEKTRKLEAKQGMIERNVMKAYRVLDPLGKNMYYEK